MKLNKKRSGQAESLPHSLSASHTDAVRNCTKAIKSPIQNYTADIRKVYGFSTKKENSVRTWLESYSEVQPFERFRGLKVLLTVFSGACTVGSIYGQRSCRACVMLSLFFFASFIGFDIGRLWSRILADKSRGLIAASLISWAVFSAFPIKESLIIAGAVTSFSVICIFFFNLRWISAQTYKRSDLVKEALQRIHEEDFESLWEGTGARLVRSLWWEAGVDADNEQYNTVKKGTFCLGYSLGVDVSADTLQSLDDLKAENEALKAEIAEADEQIDSMLDFFEQKETILAELEELRKAKAEAANRSDYDRLYFENARLKAQVLDLQIDLDIAKADLAAVKTEESEGQIKPIVPVVIQTDEERREALLEEAYSLGYGVSKAMKHAGVSHWKAQKFYEEKKRMAKEA